jgi:hypothetical protein
MTLRTKSVAGDKGGLAISDGEVPAAMRLAKSADPTNSLPVAGIEAAVNETGEMAAAAVPAGCEMLVLIRGTPSSPIRLPRHARSRGGAGRPVFAP